MIGKHRESIAYFKELNPEIITMHCIMHCQHLAANKLSVRLNDSFNFVIKAVNKIKRHALQSRLCVQLCNDEVFDKLIMYTEVKWLSTGNCLESFRLF